MMAVATPSGCTHFKLRQLLRVVARHYDAEFAAVGLKGTQFSMLSLIVSDGPLQLSELARRLGLDPSTLTRSLRLLQDAGWVAQSPGPDARTRVVSITESGRQKQIEARGCWKAAQARVRETLGVERVAALHQLIDEGMPLLDARLNV